MTDYWRSPEEITQQNKKPEPEFLMTPIQDPAASAVEGSTQGSLDGSNGHADESRREFIKLMGASLALMSASACTRRPVEKIVPYLKQPEEIVPGIANWYASSCGECESSCGIVVKTREGRPIKFEGNATHPVSQGGLCARGQASVLNVYDPDRLQNPLHAQRHGVAKAVTWEEIDGNITSKLRSIRQGRGRVVILTGAISSPSTNKLIQEFVSSFSHGAHVVFEPLSAEEVALASEASYGNRVVPRYRYDKAQMFVSFGADFLGVWHASVEASKGFSKARRLGKNAAKMASFFAFESMMTTTGSNADDRVSLRSGDELKAALALAHELIISQGHSKYAADSTVTTVLRAYPASTIASQIGIPSEAFRKVAADLWENRGKSLVLGGGQNTKGDSGIALEIVVNLLNSALENEGSTVDGTVSPSNEKSSFAALSKLIGEMKAGEIDALIMYKTNPLYSLPASLGFTDALSRVPLVVSASMQFDETARASDLVLALSHHTEAWGDASPQTGVFNIQQPTLYPLYKTRAFEENLMAWAKPLGIAGAIASSANWHEYIKENWKRTVYQEYKISTPFILFWESILREGFFDGVAARGSRNLTITKSRSFASRSLQEISGALATNAGPDTFSLILYPKVSMYDGRNANNSWLQELPDPVTKITWDNYACVSSATAKRLGLEEGDVVKLNTKTDSFELPAYIQPGLNDQTIAVALGYGRQGAGRVGTGIGVNMFAASAGGKRALVLSGIAIQLSKTGKTALLASTQKHHSMENRPIVKEANYEEYRHNPHAGNEDHEHLTTLWPKHEYPGYRWGMAIDLTSCSGCSACIIACQAENNIPTVGKKFVLTSREMHWLRIDRYYSGRVENPEVVHQPMLCQHCENAPCETVCPVLATMHNDEGLNQQIYNRCVGTRYCANNCPYKVRRFNWFTFTDVESPQNLVYNPDITVRTRGVMEKCNFCMQRIRDAKDRAKDFGARVRDGEVKTACQQSCPSDAIVFGDMNDKDSRVSQLMKDPRGYHVLEDLNVRPSITYLTKIRNKKS